MTGELRARLVDALLEHFDCIVGDTRRERAESTADVLLSLPGIAIVALPESYEDVPIVTHPYWVGYKPGAFSAYAQAHRVWLETDAKYRALTPDQARSCAAALLAAAVRAEQS